MVGLRGGSFGPGFTAGFAMLGYCGNLEELTVGNDDFRRVLYTGRNLQLVLMALQPGEEIGEEVHDDRDQFFRIEDGEGFVDIDGVLNPFAGPCPEGYVEIDLLPNDDEPVRICAATTAASSPGPSSVVATAAPFRPAAMRATRANSPMSPMLCPMLMSSSWLKCTCTRPTPQRR